MTVALLPVVTSGVLMGWSVAWPPGPINTEIARRCLARGFWAGFSLILGACSGDALWALLVALGVGLLFTGPTAQLFMGVLSIGLLAVLMVTFLRRAVQGWRGGEAQSDGPRFDSAKASYVLGATMAL
ncbi:MAG: LysE family transporter, partial [Paracoccaceae bacterium]|nr:LysE family transporter [Paracoccaceae bacterium]